MASGASGVAYGRFVWQHRDPPKLMAALKMIIHAGAGVDEAAWHIAIEE